MILLVLFWVLWGWYYDW